MKSGVHHGVPFAEYLALPAANKSGLDLLNRSPLHYWAANLDPNRAPREATPAMRLGTAIHTAVLEPERFAAEYRKRPEPADYPGCLVTLDEYKDHARTLELKLGGTKDELKQRIREAGSTAQFFDDLVAGASAARKLLAPDDWAACHAIARNVRTSPSARAIFEGGKAEVTVVWIDAETGLRCKARLDWLTDDGGLACDLKSAVDASPSGFARAVAEYNYHRQAAWYLDGVEAATGRRPDLFPFAVYETAAPYASAFYHLSAAAIELGQAENRRLLRRYADCVAKSEWPGYPDELIETDLPAWRYKQNERTLEVF